MVQVVHFMDNDIKYPDGPFVISNPLGNGWRIEAEFKAHGPSVLPDQSICDFLKFMGLPYGKMHNVWEAVWLCEWLNLHVRNNNIVLDNRCWILQPMLHTLIQDELANR